MGAILPLEMQLCQRFEGRKEWNHWNGIRQIVLFQQLQCDLVSKIIGGALKPRTLEKGGIFLPAGVVQAAINVEMLGFGFSINEFPLLAHGGILGQL